MAIHEPKCVEWKRKGAALVAREVEGLSPAAEVEYWRRKTDALKQLQEELVEGGRGAAGTQQSAAGDAATRRT